MDDRDNAVAARFDVDQLPVDVLVEFHRKNRSAAIALFVGKYGLSAADAELLLDKYSQKNSLSSGWKETIVRWLDRLLLVVLVVLFIFGLVFMFSFAR